MIKLSEIIIKKPVQNNLKQLLQLQQQIEFAKDKDTKKQLALRCAELVLPIWYYYYPNDNRVKQTIEDAKKGIYNRAAIEAAMNAINDATFNAAYAAEYATNGIFFAAKTAASRAIKATKLHFNIK